VVLLRVTQKIDFFPELQLGFARARHVGKGHPGVIGGIPPRLAASETEQTALPPRRLAARQQEKCDQEHDREPFGE
jgi:hypothetical protein